MEIWKKTDKKIKNKKMSKNASADLYRQKSTAPTEQVSRLCTHNKINTGGFFTVVTLAAIQFHTVLDYSVLTVYSLFRLFCT